MIDKVDITPPKSIEKNDGFSAKNSLKHAKNGDNFLKFIAEIIIEIIIQDSANWDYKSLENPASLIENTGLPKTSPASDGAFPLKQLNPKTMNAIAYIRVGTKEEAQQIYDGNNLQENAIKQYCKDNYIELNKVFYDIGVTGPNFERVGWEDLEAYLSDQSNQVNFLVVENYSRISRDVVQGLKKVEFLEKEYGLTVLCLSADEIPSATELNQIVNKI